LIYQKWPGPLAGACPLTGPEQWLKNADRSAGEHAPDAATAVSIIKLSIAAIVSAAAVAVADNDSHQRRPAN